MKAGRDDELAQSQLPRKYRQWRSRDMTIFFSLDKIPWIPFKVHVDGCNQRDLITGKAPSEIFDFTKSHLSALQIDDLRYRFIEQPGGWIGEKVRPDAPVLVKLRLDPFAKATWPTGDGNLGSYQFWDWFVLKF